MTVVVLGIDALDPELVDPEAHPNLTLDAHRRIDTIVSSTGEPSTHELWPTIITGLPPSEHGLLLDDGVAWESPFLRVGSRVADFLVPETIQTRIGAWLLTNTSEDAFRVSATYYEEEGFRTVFDNRRAKPIGIPNYVTDPDEEDREHQLRRRLGDLFERDPDAHGGHSSSDPAEFYERCMEMAMIRITRVRRALRSRRYELVFGYTSGLDLIGHIAFDRPNLQTRAYGELDDFVGELYADLSKDDELLIVSDHGLQDGLHTNEAMVAGSAQSTVNSIESVLDVYSAVNAAIANNPHHPGNEIPFESETADANAVRDQLEDLGYL